MENKGIINPQDIQIQGVLDSYLRSRVSDKNLVWQERHLDEDSLTAFAEGNLSERELQPVVGHLVECSFCRQVTTELVRLDLAFAEKEVEAVVAEKRPSKISEVLESLLSHVFGANDGAVFAHEEKKEDSEGAENLEDEEK